MLATKSSLLHVLPFPAPWEQVHKSPTIHFRLLSAADLHFWLSLAVCKLCTGASLKRGEHLHQVFQSRSQQQCTPTVWRWMGCGHTYLFSVAVCSEGSVSSPPQCSSVVIEVPSRVHLVLDTQKTTHWLEHNLHPLKAALPLVVPNRKQSLAYIFKNPHAHKTREPQIQWELCRHRSCL